MYPRRCSTASAGCLGQRQLGHQRADISGLDRLLVGTRTARFQPGAGLVGEPSFTGSGAGRGSCRRWPSRSRSATSGRSRAPQAALRPAQGVRVQALAGEKQRVEFGQIVILHERGVGSSRLMARKAVGAVKRLRTLCCEITRQTRRRPACRPACLRRGCWCSP